MDWGRTWMSKSDKNQDRIDAVLKRLEEIDPRFIMPAEDAPAPFAKEVAQGPAGFKALLQRVVVPTLDGENQFLALHAMEQIASEHAGGIDEKDLFRLAEWLQSEDHSADIRSEAMRVLLCAQSEPMLQGARQRLVHGTAAEQSAAAHALGVAKSKVDVEILKVALAQGGPGVQTTAAWALGEIGDPAALPLLEAAFKAEKVLVPVIEALGKIGGAEQVPLLTLCLSEPSSTIRLAGAEALARIMGRTEDPTTELEGLGAYLEQALKHESDPMIGVVLIASLTRLGIEVSAASVQRVLGIDFANDAIRGKLLSLFKGTK